ncbi:hypothetical protein LTR35_017908 [Friedmanniomyces endolithicus]|nr:hypothetical protein LTR35_017908 [Friedmanniomyces endolithicus]KAK0267166.1 hypothetical protein LTS00_017864 [Friedmanniomyces endolithicus]KAK0301905.1 hypothetical protein LTR01_009089 [Friedmanniomyces endolithicus]KAK0822787.1 hypothetical protein LTR73_009034 [Friedmanniomyces endolithicus]KAK0970699.1 hypothetical protein LTR54_017919 [Friedmanniomyces endolithicus]
MGERWKLWRAVPGWKKEILSGTSTFHASTAALTDTSCSIITISGAECLSEKERANVYNLARELQYQNALVAHLDAMTPPVDSQEAFEEQREHEMNAREELRADGCPPCYPADVDISMEDVPEVHKDGVEYFRISTSWGEEVLPQQLVQWRRFRAVQQDIRRRYGQKFDRYLANLRERRRVHNLPADVSLLLDHTLQDSLQTWVEFQDVCIQGHDATVIELKKIDAVSEHNGYADDSANFLRDRLARHEGLLRWVENQRLVMEAHANTHEQQVESPNVKYLHRGSPALSRTSGKADYLPHRGEVGVRMAKARGTIVKIRPRRDGNVCSTQLAWSLADFPDL